MNNQKRLRNLQHPSKDVGVSTAKLFATVVAKAKSHISAKTGCHAMGFFGRSVTNWVNPSLGPPHKTRTDAMLDLNIGTPISFVDKRASLT